MGRVAESHVSIESDIKEFKSFNEFSGNATGERLKHVLTIAILASLILFVMVTNLIHSQSTLDPFLEYGRFKAYLFLTISVIPYLSLPVAFINCCGLILFNPFVKSKVTPGCLSSAPFLCFRTVTRGDMPDFVKRNALINSSMCSSFGLDKFVVEIVTDNEINCHGSDPFIREIVVPRDYITKKKTMFKARALNYCLEGAANTLAGNDWIVHLDEETLLTKDSLSGILHFVTEGNADIGQGPISYANGEVIKNWVTTLADSIRLGLDYALFRFQFALLHRPMFGLKGSYIVIRNRVEMDVGLDLGPEGSIAEDCFFALKAWAKGYTFDFITGEMREKSPFTLMDYIRQRRRWFVGQLYTVLSKEIPLQNKLCLSLSLTCCILMPISFSNIVINIVYPFRKPVIFCVMNGLVGGSFMFLYAFGSFLSTSHRNWSYARRICICITCAFFIIPLAAVLESIAAYWGLFTMNSNDFFIIQKDHSHNIKERGRTKIM